MISISIINVTITASFLVSSNLLLFDFKISLSSLNLFGFDDSFVFIFSPLALSVL